MIDYFIINNSGLIIQKGVCQQESEIPNGNVILKKAPYDATHYKNGVFSTETNIDLARFEALQKRQSLLLGTDWTQLPDVNVDQEAWAEYRQQLRDITQQAGFPTKIEWPLAPNED
jgi:hypothetical protein